MADKSVIEKNFINCVDRIIQNNKISHAYLIELNNYEEDLSFVYHFIKMILCNLSYSDVEHSDNPILQQIDHQNYPDIKVISSESGVINKSLILDLQKEYSNKSLLNGKRIYIIKEAEKLNGYSANTILKFLEEPEEDIIAFLLTDNRYHVLDTILSRCQVLSLKDDQLFFETDNDLCDFLDCIINPETFFIKYNYYMKDFFVDKSVLANHLLEVENVVLTYLENNKLLTNELCLLLSKKDDRELINILSIIEDEFPKLSFNVNLKLWCDSFFSKLIGG